MYVRKRNDSSQKFTHESARSKLRGKSKTPDNRDIEKQTITCCGQFPTKALQLDFSKLTPYHLILYNPLIPK